MARKEVAFGTQDYNPTHGLSAEGELLVPEVGIRTRSGSPVKLFGGFISDGLPGLSETATAATNTAFIETIEASYQGYAIDLGGGVYPVSSLPNGCNYHNGGFSISGEVYWMPRNPRAHPFEFPATYIKSILPREGVFAGLSSCLFQVPDSPRMIALYRAALGHATLDSDIRMAVSDDCFNSSVRVPASPNVSPQRTIYEDTGYDIRNCASGIMGNGRIGSVWARESSSLGYKDGLFLYCDNPTAAETAIAWSTVNISFTSTTFDSHGKIHPWPASAGGHDTLGFIFYTYSAAPNPGICAYTTVDNGATWTEHLRILVPNGSVANLSEMDVAKMPGTDTYVMCIRVNTYMACSTSTDLLTWTAPVLTSLYLDSNPIAVIPDMGAVWAIAFSRRANALVTEHANAIVISRGDVARLAASGGADGWSEWRVVIGATFWPTGYISLQQVRGRWYGLFLDGEDTAGSTTSRTAYMSLLCPDPPPIASTREILNQIPARNMIPTGSFMYWPIGTSFASGARTPVLPGMTFARANGGAGCTLSRQAGELGEYCLEMGRDDDDSNANGPVLNIVFTGSDSVNLRKGFITVSGFVRPLSGFSATDRKLIIRARQTTSAESQVTLATGAFSTNDAVVQSSNNGVILGPYGEFFSVTIGPFIDNANVYDVSTMLQALVQVTWACSGTASNDKVRIEWLKCEEGKEATPFVYPSLHDLKNWSDRFYQTFSVRSINGTIWIPFGQHMHTTPTVTVSAGSAANITTAGFELTHTSAATITVTASAWL